MQTVKSSDVEEINKVFEYRALWTISVENFVASAMTTMTEIGDVQMLCQLCKKNLAGLRYVLHESKPYCVVCYEGNFSHKCEACRAIIGTDCKVRRPLGNVFSNFTKSVCA